MPGIMRFAPIQAVDVSPLAEALGAFGEQRQQRQREESLESKRNELIRASLGGFGGGTADNMAPTGSDEFVQTMPDNSLPPGGENFTQTMPDGSAPPGDAQVVELMNGEAFARLASMDPNAANAVGMILQRRDAQRAAMVQQEADSRLRDLASIYEIDDMDTRARHMIRIAQKNPRLAGDIQGILSITDKVDQDIALLRELRVGQDIKDVIGQVTGDGEGFTLSSGQTRFDQRGNPIASVDDPNADIKRREIEAKEGKLALDREKFAAEQAKAGLPDDNEAFSRASKLRGEFINITKDFALQNDSIGRVRAAADDPSPAGDLALIFNYMKILDPGSTVRETEFANAENAGSIPQRIWAQFNKVQSGERLSPEQRKDFVGRAGKLFGAARAQHAKRETQYRALAKRSKVDPDLVVFDRTTAEVTLEDLIAERERR